MESSYPFDDYVPLPPNLNLPDKTENPGTKNYTKASNNEQYNYFLQNILDNGYIMQEPPFCSYLKLPAPIHRLRKAAETVRNTGTLFQFNAPVHAYENDWYGRDPNGCKPFVSRDQTVPEMRLIKLS